MLCVRINLKDVWGYVFALFILFFGNCLLLWVISLQFFSDNMARLYLKREKNMEFYAACEKIRSEANGYMSTKDIASLAENTSCSSFFMSEYHIKRLIWEINTDRHKWSKFKHIKDKHDEIYKRYKFLLFETGDKPLSWYARQISKQKAPRFYLDKDYAMILYYKLMNNQK